MKALNYIGNVYQTSLLVLVLLIVAIGGTYGQAAIPVGDVNGNGIIDIVDALLTARYSAGLNPPGFIPGAADADASGEVNVVDALVIARYTAGLIPSLPPGGQTPIPTPTPSLKPTLPPGFVIKINFQNSQGPFLSGFLPDYGELYGSRNGYNYGWNKSHTDVVFSRNLRYDQRLDTVVHFHTGGVWELAIPDGSYLVTASVGDSLGATCTLNLEGTGFWNAVPLAAGQFEQRTMSVAVADGRLTVDCGTNGEKQTRLNYLKVRALNLSALQPVPLPTSVPSVASHLPYHQSGGYGTKTNGGLEGAVLRITNLNATGPGSLRAALEALGPRLIIFDVGGVIDLNQSLVNVNNPYLTVAGQTAPAPGITIIKGSLIFSTHDVVVSHIAVRPGDAGAAKLSGWEPDGIDLEYSYNVVMDHVATTWAVDENLTVSGGHDITLYRCFVAEGLSYSTHVKPEHSKGSIIFHGAQNVSLIGCLYAHNVMRNPRVSDCRAVVVNDFVYNWGQGMDVYRNDYSLYSYAVHLGDNGESNVIPEVTFIGNTGMQGPDSLCTYFVSGHKSEYGRAYVSDNLIKGRAEQTMSLLDAHITSLSSPPLWPAGLTVYPVKDAVSLVLKTAGPRANERSPVEARIIKEIIYRTGSIIDSQDEVGGYPRYTLANRVLTPPSDVEARRMWLDELAAQLDTDTALDTKPLTDFLFPVF